jgi:hypothetical protein
MQTHFLCRLLSSSVAVAFKFQHGGTITLVRVLLWTLKMSSIFFFITAFKIVT